MTWSVTMRQSHIGGDKLFVDYAGDTVPVIVDRLTGQVRAAQIFIAVMGASNITYAEASWTRLGLDSRGVALGCGKGHSFDLARDGYVNLLPGNRRRPAAGGDGSAQLRHRSAFLDAGHFGFITAAIAERLQHGQIRSAGGGRHVLDAGCGTGHHLASIAAAFGPGAVGLGLDISAAAARLAARSCPGLAFAVADLWSEWPVQDAAFDLVLSIFAPRNLAETMRVLRPGGWLALGLSRSGPSGRTEAPLPPPGPARGKGTPVTTRTTTRSRRSGGGFCRRSRGYS
jgi:SAM-dependent methyltransferase